MLGFSHFLKSNFGDSATPLTSPLEPRLKTGQGAATTPSPEYFDTPVGKRRVPREKDPKKPNYEMITDARQGILSGFLRRGRIFRASDFIGIVNPKTAIITLNDIYDFETRCLTAISHQPTLGPPTSSVVPFKKTADKGADDEKTLRNLFYISLNQDELPSFHFWTKPGDLDPVTAGEPIDWGNYFDQNPPSPPTIAKITMLENKRKGKIQHGAEEQQNTDTKQTLDFLNRYNNINLPGLNKEPTEGRPSGDIDPIPQTSASSAPAQSPLEAEVLLQFNRGGMYLREFTHTALYAMACWLVKNEEEDEEEEEYKDEEDEGKKGPRDIFLDILEPGKNVREEKVVSVSRASHRNFQENIKPFFGQSGNKFRIRSTRYESSWNLSSGFDSGGVGELKSDLKLVRPNVGYCYCSANWHLSGDLGLNSLRFEKAIKVLFDWESSAHPNSDHLSLGIPGYDHPFNLSRNSDVVLDANIQEIFFKLSNIPTKPDSHPVEIFVRDIVDDADVSDFLGTGQSNEHSLMKAREIGGGSDMLSIQPQLLTVSEINRLQERLRLAEASNVETDDLQERLKIAEEKLSEMSGLKERLKISEDRARLKSSCPFCPQDWAGVTRQQQQDHLKLHQKSIVHQPAPQKCPQPGCTSWLGENQRESTFEDISEHLRLHIEEEHAEDGICEHQNCHTNMYALTAEQQDEHESIHRDNRKVEEERDWLLERVRGLEETLEKPDQSQNHNEILEEIVKERDLLQGQVSDLEETVTERDRLQQQVRNLQDAANERDRLQQDVMNTTRERDSFQERVMELERRLEAAPSFEGGMQTRGAAQATIVGEDPKQPNQHEAPKKLRYCNVCLKSVDKMSADAKVKHADKCKTNVSEFLLFSPAEAKAEREKRNRSRDVAKPQAQEMTEEGAKGHDREKTRKRKASAKAAPPESQQDEAEDVSTDKQPQSSKVTGRKTLKRKNDAYKPPKQDESGDEELESPRKKPKLKAKAAKIDKETAPTRRSTRGKDIYRPPEEEDDEEEEEEEEAYDEPSSSAPGGKGKKKVAAVKKAKTKKK